MRIIEKLRHLKCLEVHFTGVHKQCRPKSDAAKTASDLGLHCLHKVYCNFYKNVKEQVNQTPLNL